MGNSSSSSDLAPRQIKARNNRLKRKTRNPEYGEIYRGVKDGFQGRNIYSNGNRDHDTEMTDYTDGPTSSLSQRDKKFGAKALSSRVVKSKKSLEEIELPPVTIFGENKTSLNQNKSPSTSSSNNTSDLQAKEANRIENTNEVHSTSSRKISARALPPSPSSQQINSASNAKPAVKASSAFKSGAKKTFPTSKFKEGQIGENDLLSPLRTNEIATLKTLEDVADQKPFFVPHTSTFTDSKAHRTNISASSPVANTSPTGQVPVSTEFPSQPQPTIPIQTSQIPQNAQYPPSTQFQPQWLQQQSYYPSQQLQPFQQFSSPLPFSLYNAPPFGQQPLPQQYLQQPLTYPPQFIQPQQYTTPYNIYPPALQPGIVQLNYPFNSQMIMPVQPNQQMFQAPSTNQQLPLFYPQSIMQQSMQVPYSIQMQMSPKQVQTSEQQQSHAQAQQGLSQSTTIKPVLSEPAAATSQVPVPLKTITTTAPVQVPEVSSDDRTKYAKYFTMKKMRVPDGGIRNKMIMDGLTDADMDYFFSLP